MSGLWGTAAVPHKGWRLVDVEDLGEPDHMCEMCVVTSVRYVHHIEHESHPSLAVGCICAEKLCEDYVRPKELESRLVLRERRRLKWPRRKWRCSKGGDSYFLRTNGLVFIVTERCTASLVRERYWDRTTMQFVPKWTQHGKRRHPSMEAAKVALFDYVWPAKIRPDGSSPVPGWPIPK
jgi:hypothetical protein